MWRPLLVLFSLCSTAVAAVPTLPVPSSADLRLPHPLGDAFLVRPEACRPTCPLLIVSHSRGMTATESLSRAHLTRMFQKFSRAGVAVLVSDDAGSRTWGEPKALEYLAEVREAAIQEFAFSGNTYTMGYSMGGLPALLVAFKEMFPVSGVILLDARVNLMDAWQASDLTRREEIARAYGLATTDPLPFGADPVNDFFDVRTRALPLFVAGSPDDQTVPLRSNGEALLARNTSRETRFHLLSGPHLGASHFADPVTDAMLAFVDRQEHLARAAKRNDARRRTTSRPEAVLQKKP